MEEREREQEEHCIKKNSNTVENIATESQNKLWLKRKKGRKEREKTDGGIKSGEEWEFCTGGMDGWVVG